MLRCTLKIWAGRADRPVAPIIELLRHRAASIREAALAAVPRTLSKTNAAALLELLGDFEQETVIFALRAIGKTGCAKDAEALLDKLLASSSQKIRIASLDVLMTKWGRLGKTNSVLELTQRTDLSLAVRGRAILCLERTGSYMGMEPGQDLPIAHPYLKYFTARCLIHGGDRRGIDLLLEVLEANRLDFAGLKPDKVDNLIAASRKLLFLISGVRPGKGRRDWEQWLSRVDAIPTRRLPAPPWNF